MAHEEHATFAAPPFTVSLTEQMSERGCTFEPKLCARPPLAGKVSVPLPAGSSLHDQRP